MDPWGFIASQVKKPKGAIITCDSGESDNPMKSGEIHQFGGHMGPVHSSAANLLRAKGSFGLRWGSPFGKRSALIKGLWWLEKWRMPAEMKQNEPLAEDTRVSLHSCLCHCSLKGG